MSTTAVTVALAASASANASSAATAAHRAECALTISNFDSKAATLGQMKEYASCVNYLHPADLSSSTLLTLKVSIIVSFMLAFLVVFIHRKNLDWLERVFGFFAVWFLAFIGLVLIIGAACFVVS